jgi:hypothetical protein
VTKKNLGQEGKGLANGPNWRRKKWQWSNGWGKHIGECRVPFRVIWWQAIATHSLERLKVSKLCTFLGDLLGCHDGCRRKVPDFTLEIQAYRWPALKFWRNLAIYHPKKAADWYWNKLGVYILLPHSHEVLQHQYYIYQDWTLYTNTTFVWMFFNSSKHINTIFQGCTLHTSTTLVHTFLRRSSGNPTQHNQPWELILSFPTYLSLFMIWISHFATYYRPLHHGTVTPWCFLVQNVQQPTSSRLWKHGSTL